MLSTIHRLTAEQKENIICVQGANAVPGHWLWIKQGKSCGSLAFDHLLLRPARRAWRNPGGHSEGAVGPDRRRFAGRSAGKDAESGAASRASAGGCAARCRLTRA